MTDAASNDDKDNGRPGSCQRLWEGLVPQDTFGAGHKADRALNCSRCCLFTLYLVLIAVFLGSLLMYMRGRVEIVDHRMKYSRLEAPSVAVCPFNPGTKIQERSNASYSIYAVKLDLQGTKKLPNKPRKCKYDRECMCLDLNDVKLYDVDDKYDGYHGPTGLSSQEIQNFRERIEIHTTLMDTSRMQTLKIGFYDSEDKRPSWFFARQYYFVLGQLRMDSWMVSEATGENVMAMITGDISRLDRRHFYSYVYSDTDASMDEDEDHKKYTRLSYEFRTFFVVETISAQSTMSLFTIFALLLLVVALSNALMIWEMLFPIYIDGKIRRRVAPPLVYLSKFCCCTELEHDHDEEDARRRSYGTMGSAS